ncbi:class I SAM-dependent methyltransferase [Caulobacter sp. NIBR2454]|uniref:class I SAM-dependent methyltransferase n=1 Tax=Caulobacter sp. NIBR2454 TaxID=3015996 RepID=UPI0022B728C9|nr:class I SAM-dependent methyltransferase [Caulobacter sp. NIBR2454]
MGAAPPDFQVQATGIPGVRRLEPVPDQAYLHEYYASTYYEALAPGDRRLNADPDAVEEMRWMRESPHADVIATLRELGAGSRTLDIGCGLGELVGSLTDAGFEARGLDPSTMAVEHGRALGRNLIASDLEPFADDLANHGCADVIILSNVLEHIPHPAEVLKRLRRLLAPGGIVMIRVPNDFSALQEKARAAVDQKPWWVAIPDHVNYFTAEGLENFLAAESFEVLRRTADFPLELFLLMGEDYTRDPALGKSCHQRRRRLELAMGQELRMKFNQAMAAIGMGRNTIVFARPR